MYLPKIILKFLNRQHQELNELIYAGAKLVRDKIAISLRNPKRRTNPGWEIRL